MYIKSFKKKIDLENKQANQYEHDFHHEVEQYCNSSEISYIHKKTTTITELGGKFKYLEVKVEFESDDGVDYI